MREEKAGPKFLRENYDPKNKDTWPSSLTSDEGITDLEEAFEILDEIAMFAIEGEMVTEKTPEVMQSLEKAGALLHGLINAVTQGRDRYSRELRSKQSTDLNELAKVKRLNDFVEYFEQSDRFYSKYKDLVVHEGGFGATRWKKDQDQAVLDFVGSAFRYAQVTDHRNNTIAAAYDAARAGLFSSGDDVTPAGRAPVKLEKSLPLTSSGIEGIPSLSESIDYVRNKTTDDGILGSSALVDSIDIEDLDVHAIAIYDEDEKEKKLRLRFKLTPWAMLRKENELQDSSPSWSKQTPTVAKAQLQKTGEVAVTDKDVPNFNFQSGTNYVYLRQDTGVAADITITSAQVKEGTMNITDEITEQGPSALHGQVVIDLPIDASLDDITQAMQLAGVRDVRPATEADLDILAENRLLSLFAKKNDPTENVKDQATRAELLSEIKKEWGVTAQDLVPTVGRHGRVNLLLPKETAEAISSQTGTIGFGHDVSIQHILSDLEQSDYRHDLNMRPAKKKTFESDWGSMLVPQAVRVEATATAVANLVKRGILSTVTRSNEGLQYKGLSSNADMSTGGADYIFLSPVDLTRDEYSKTRPTGGVGTASLYISAENVFNRSDVYANAYDAYGKRVIGSDTVTSAKPGGYETMLRHGLDVVQPGNNFIVEGTVRERALEILAEDGITEINGISLKDFLISSVRSTTDEARLKKGVSGGVLAEQMDRAGGNMDSVVEVRDINALLSLSGSPYAYHHMPPGTQVVASSYTISGSGDYRNKDDVKNFEMGALPSLYVMYPDKTLYILKPGDNYTVEPPMLVDDDWMNDVLRAVGGEGRTPDELDILPMTGKAYLAGYGGSPSSGWSGQAIVPTGQNDAGIDVESESTPEYIEGYTKYIEDLLKGISYDKNKAFAKAQYTKILGKLLPLYMSNIGDVVDSNGVSLRSKIVTALLNARNAVLGEERDTPIISSADDTPKLLPVDYDSFIIDGNYVNPLSGDIVLEDIDGENAGHIRPVYYVGVAPVVKDLVVTGTYVIVETNKSYRGQYYLDKGTFLVVDPITHEMQFSSHGIKYKIRALQPSDKKKAQKRA